MSTERMTASDKALEAVAYVAGSNELLDNIREGEPVWIVNGSIGRIPLIADSAEDAVKKYRAKLKARKHYVSANVLLDEAS